MCILLLSAQDFEWGRYIGIDMCPSQGEGSGRCKLLRCRFKSEDWAGPRHGQAVLVQGHKGRSEGWCLTADTWESEARVTCPLQSQGSLKATYSPSLLYMPRLVLVGFSLASSWNCILAILSKSLERWRWTYKWRACPGSHLRLLLRSYLLLLYCLKGYPVTTIKVLGTKRLEGS